jgi:hypothetical protein
MTEHPDNLKKGAKTYLPLSAFDDYSMDKKLIDKSMTEAPRDWDGEVVYEVQILRRFVGEVKPTATLKEF